MKAGPPHRCGNMRGHPTYHVNVIKSKEEIIRAGGLPHRSGLPHLPGVPYQHVNRHLVSSVICLSPPQGLFAIRRLEPSEEESAQGKMGREQKK